MTVVGQKRRFDPLAVASGLPRTTDIVRPLRHVRKQTRKPTDFIRSRRLEVYAQCQFNFTSIFPMFSPLKSPRKASGAFSMPRKTV